MEKSISSKPFVPKMCLKYSFVDQSFKGGFTFKLSNTNLLPIFNSEIKDYKEIEQMESIKNSTQKTCIVLWTDNGQSSVKLGKSGKGVFLYGGKPTLDHVFMIAQGKSEKERPSLILMEGTTTRSKITSRLEIVCSRMNLHDQTSQLKRKKQQRNKYQRKVSFKERKLAWIRQIRRRNSLKSRMTLVRLLKTMKNSKGRGIIHSYFLVQVAKSRRKLKNLPILLVQVAKKRRQVKSTNQKARRWKKKGVSRSIANSTTLLNLFPRVPKSKKDRKN